MNKQYEVLKWASSFLEKNNCESNIAEILLQHHLHVSRSQFYTMMRDPIASSVVNQFKADIKEHTQTGIPVQHLLGYEMFYGRKFCVNENVLIPRPETEELVQHVIKMDEHRSPNQRPTIIDIGTGSGVIATTLALEIPDATVYATDISKEALMLAEKNASRNGAKVMFLQGDFLQPLINKQIRADIIVSNPPYISRSDEPSLSKTVKDFDPGIALFADDNGLAAYKQIINHVSKVSKSGSIIAFEIGYEQGKSVCSLIKSVFPMSHVTVIQDINGKDRIVSAKLNEY